MIQVNEQDIDKITAVFYSILKGKKPEEIELPKDYPDNEIRQVVGYVNKFIVEYNDMTDFAYHLGRGEINIEPPKGTMLIVQSFKSLQASLKNLTWTTQQIATGDFSHKVNFMGEFSEAFNSMAQQLQASFQERKLANEDLHDQILQLDKARKSMLNILEDLDEAREAANEANKAKSTFLANMSHDIRTPMNAVLGFSEILHSMIKDEQQRDYLASIRSSGKSLLGLINDILDLSKVEAGKLELEYGVVDVQSVLNDMKSMFSHKVQEQGIDFIIESDENLPKALILDELRIRQILINLLGNSVKFTEKGYVKLKAGFLVDPENSSQIDLQISVQDTGIGIPDDQKEKVFEAFGQTEGQSTAKFGGTGLGLAITKKLITMMNGDVNVTGKLGEGSSFNVTLRNVVIASVTDMDNSESDTIDRSSLEFEPASVLVIDDHELNRKLVLGYLEPFNFTIYKGVNGEELLELAEKHKPDLILTDIKMPVMNGYDATCILKSNPDLRGIPVVALTASVMMQDEDKVKEICDGYLRKPVSMNEILIELTKFLKHTKTELAPAEVDSDDTNEEKEFESTSDSQVNFPELLEKLKSDFEPQWNELKDNLIIDEIEQFAYNIKEFGKEYQYGKIANWGAKLENQAGMFDIEAMTKTLEEFPDIIQDIESKI